MKALQNTGPPVFRNARCAALNTLPAVLQQVWAPPSLPLVQRPVLQSAGAALLPSHTQQLRVVPLHRGGHMQVSVLLHSNQQMKETKG